ncbi:MAG: Type 1 glutamine amidotransferase-like domain-containing protein [Candidatus Pacebacteria bacterium]|nr:Type 1 glutamine amidotransferase-like domain-containing protein [Candidatus Paceibacterota bacterium]
MTKYILNSGGVSNNPDLAKKFYAEIFEGLNKNPRLLICAFAQPREDWDQRFKDDQEGMSNLFPEGVDPVFELAFPEKFEEQVKKADVVYIHGGDDYLLQFWLKQFDLPKIWEGKVVATSSAGSDALVKYFWTCDWRQCMDGMGILPVKFLPHFGSTYGADDSRGPIDWNKGLEELKKYKEDLPVYALKEGEYQVFEI